MAHDPEYLALKEALVGLGVGIGMMIVVFLFAHFVLGLPFFP
ncbi:hypothetical protein [Alkalihalobacillus deserti]|nr:hypothetical protein [Alkalihalobacillus deserti]